MRFHRIQQFKAWLFPVHAWTYNEANDFRTCTVCARTEEFDGGGGMTGAAWFYVTAGRRMAHVALTSSGAA